MNKAEPTRTVVVLGFERAQVLDMVGPMQLFAAVNTGRAVPSYDVSLLAERAGPLLTSGGIKLVADGDYGALPKTIDTLVVSGGQIDKAMHDARLLAALRKGAGRARRIASVCSGAFLLAAAGILDGRRATTHWGYVERLAREFPKVNVERDAIYVQDGNVWTSAGVTAGMDLALALIREDHGDEVALAIARHHVLFLMRPGGQSQFSAHLAPDAYPKGRLAPLLRWIPEHVDAELDVPTLARRANMSERSFARIFARETGETPARYVERARLDAARRMLTASDLPAGTVAMRAGFGSEERMRRAFQRHLKISPGAFRARFQLDGHKEGASA